MFPAVKTVSFIRKGLNVQEGMYCYGLPAWGYLVVGCSGSMIWELYLAPNFLLFLLTQMLACFPRNMYISTFRTGGLRTKSKSEERLSLIHI